MQPARQIAGRLHFFCMRCNFHPPVLRYYSVTDRETFNGLMIRYRRLLFAVCCRYARRGLDADDLLQEVMLALWHHRETMTGINSPPKQAAWIWRVARSTCIDIMRRTPPPCPLPEGYDAAAADNTNRLALRELIALLDEPDRTIVTMHLEGYEYKEIGKATGMSKNNVGVRLMRIKDKLKEQWNRTE